MQGGAGQPVGMPTAGGGQVRLKYSLNHMSDMLQNMFTIYFICMEVH